MLKEKLAKGEFVRALEVIPPKNSDISGVLKHAGLMGDIDLITVVDSPLGRPLMNPIPVAHLIEKKVKRETLVHFTCRDRNLNEIKASLLGAHALGLRNILALTGDATRLAKPVFERHSITLLEEIGKLNREAGCSLFPGAGGNPNANNLEAELKKIGRKVSAGANFIMTQPVFDAKKAKAYAKSVDVPVIFGILLFSNKKSVEFFSKVPGITLPKEAAALAGNRKKLEKFYRKLLSELKGFASGIAFMPIDDGAFSLEL